MYEVTSVFNQLLSSLEKDICAETFMAPAAKTTDFKDSFVMAHLRCETKRAKLLQVLDFDLKVKKKGQYDIGGTYTNDEPDFWFLFTTNNLMSPCYVVNVFVCNRRAGSFAIIMGDIFPKGKGDDIYEPSTVIKECTFENLPPNTFSFIKTYAIPKSSVSQLGSEVVFAIDIHAEEQFDLDDNITELVKLDHDFDKLNELNCKDLTLESSDGEIYSVHKLIMVGHSGFFRKKLRDGSANYLKLDEKSEDLQQLINFVYNGEVHINSANIMCLMNLGIKYKLEGLCKLTQYALPQHLTIDNAIDILLIAYNNNLKKLLQSTFDFIGKNQTVFQSDAWAKLESIQIMKELFQHVSFKG